MVSPHLRHFAVHRFYGDGPIHPPRFSHIGCGPFGFDWFAAFVIGEDGIHVLDVVQRFEDRFAGRAIAVFVQPLNIADPNRGLRQFIGVVVDLDAKELLRAGFGKGGHGVDFGTKLVDRLAQIEQLSQRHIEKVTAATSRVEHAHFGNLVGKASQQSVQFVVAAGVGAAILAFVPFCAKSRAFCCTSSQRRRSGVINTGSTISKMSSLLV